MGFKTSNYTIEELGLTLPTAYAVIRNLYISGENGTAEFVIQTSRDNAFDKTPLRVIPVEFKVNRNEKPYETAYRQAKELVTVQRGEKTITHPRPFYGWEDDIPTA